MENKFYTPKEDEFHVGFEYEWKSISGDFIKEKISNSTELIEFLKNTGDIIRVKYLNSEDINSLGFYNEKDVYSTYNKRFVHKRDERTHYSLGLNDDNYSIFISIINSNSNKELAIIFCGKIKNKSELKKLLIQLNIINE